MTDLLTDLQVDRYREPSGAVPVRRAVPARRAAPALELRVTPLEWSLPGVTRFPAGIRLRGGPVQVAVTLRA